MSYKISQLAAWLDDVSGPRWLWYAKYLAANDTNANPKVHQSGPYMAKQLLPAAFPELFRRTESEWIPDLNLPVTIDSHQVDRIVRLVWYNSKNEAHLTRWGGSSSPLLTPEAPGSLVVFAFEIKHDKDAAGCRIWLCDSAEEEAHVLSAIGDVEPGRGVLFSPSGRFHPSLDSEGSCSLSPESIPPDWIENFPAGAEIIRWVIEERSHLNGLPVDDRLVKRRACELDVFLSIEKEHVLPRASEGFKTVAEFVDFANAVTNRRKSRSGRSLELHLRRIFDEECVMYSPQPRTEGGRTPDFLFPSHEAYHDSKWPVDRLRMLAVKTTCKDRWRQVLNEAERVQPTKHLFTLQEGVSAEQCREMREEGVVLVVPSGNFTKFPDEVQGDLRTLESFLDEVRPLSA